MAGKDAPGPRTAFAGRSDLAPNTAYHVAGRGTFYTDATGKVTYVETEFGRSGSLNADLIHPHPDTTYVVGGDHVFHTDAMGRTDHVHVDQLGVGHADRSEWIQQRIGHQGGAGYDGGHLLGRQFGGGGEDLNVVPMLRSVNQAGPHSFYNLEAHWKSLLEHDPNTKIQVDIRPHYPPGSKVPDRIVVKLSVDGEKQKPEVFLNG